MTKSVSLSRRRVIQGAAGSAVVGLTGFPAIVKAQADAVKLGHLTPRTGFLGTLGEYAVMAVDLAVEEINSAGGVMGRKLDVIKETAGTITDLMSTRTSHRLEWYIIALIMFEVALGLYDRFWK